MKFYSLQQWLELVSLDNAEINKDLEVLNEARNKIYETEEIIAKLDTSFLRAQ